MKPHRLARIATAWSLLLLLALLSATVRAFPSAPYMPLADGNTWTYLTNGVPDTVAVQPGTYLVNGQATKLTLHASGDQNFSSNDASGIREHKSFVASIYISGYGFTSATQTLSPPIIHAHAETSIGATLYQSGVDTLDYTGIGAFPLSYSWSSTIVGYETVTVPAGTFNAIKISETLVVYGYIGATYVVTNGSNTVWAVPNLGSVKSVNVVDGVTETRELTASNLLRPIAGLSPTSLNFGSQTQNTTGATQSVVLTNSGNQALGIWSLYTQPSNLFPMSSDCGVSLAPGGSCNIQVSFAPVAPGSVQGTLVVTDNAGDSPQSVSLYGTGLGPTYLGTLSPTSLAFGNQATATTSGVRSVSFSNTGTGSLNVLAITTTGAYSQYSDCPAAPLAAGSSCTLAVAFRPESAGSQAGTLTLSSDASNSPHQLNLSGTGLTPLAGAVVSSLTTGWNLLGNGTSGPVAVATVFGDANQVNTVWKWLPGASPGWAFYTPLQADGGAAYAASMGYSPLTTVQGGEGFWVNASAAFAIPVGSGSPHATANFRDGSASAGTNPLPPGWSLIAVGDNPSPRAFTNGIALTPPAPGTPAATPLTTLWAWYPGSVTQAAGWFFYAPSLDNSGALATYIGASGYLDFETLGKTLDPTTGFWVNHP